MTSKFTELDLLTYKERERQYGKSDVTGNQFDNNARAPSPLDFLANASAIVSEAQEFNPETSRVSESRERLATMGQFKLTSSGMRSVSPSLRSVSPSFRPISPTFRPISPTFRSTSTSPVNASRPAIEAASAAETRKLAAAASVSPSASIKQDISTRSVYGKPEHEMMLDDFSPPRASTKGQGHRTIELSPSGPKKCANRECENACGQPGKPRSIYCSKRCQSREQNLRQGRIKNASNAPSRPAEPAAARSPSERSRTASSTPLERPIAIGPGAKPVDRALLQAALMSEIAEQPLSHATQPLSQYTLPTNSLFKPISQAFSQQQLSQPIHEHQHFGTSAFGGSPQPLAVQPGGFGHTMLHQSASSPMSLMSPPLASTGATPPPFMGGFALSTSSSVLGHSGGLFQPIHFNDLSQLEPELSSFKSPQTALLQSSQTTFFPVASHMQSRTQQENARHAFHIGASFPFESSTGNASLPTQFYGGTQLLSSSSRRGYASPEPLPVPGITGVSPSRFETDSPTAPPLKMSRVNNTLDSDVFDMTQLSRSGAFSRQ